MFLFRFWQLSHFLSSSGSSLSLFKQAKRFGELRFVVHEDDAMEESASLVCQRNGELPSVAEARRARSTGSNP